MIIKKNDFVEIEYTGIIKDEGTVFDTTIEKVAKENNIYDKHSDYSAMVVCIGENHMLKGLEEQVVGKETGKEYTLDVPMDKAFGKKDGKLIQLIPTSKFRQQKIEPMVGLQLNIDGVFGMVKTVSGGRCYVDFNHPLSGKDLVYKVKINRVVDDDSEKLKSLLRMHLHIKDANIEIKEGAADVKVSHAIPKEAQEELKETASKTIPSIKSINFTAADKKQPNQA